MAQTLHFVIRRLQMQVGYQHHIDFEARLDRQDVGTLLVQ